MKPMLFNKEEFRMAEEDYRLIYNMLYHIIDANLATKIAMRKVWGNTWGWFNYSDRRADIRELLEP